MSDNIDLPHYSKGKRSTFFKDEASDHLLAMVIELSTELGVVYAKVDRLERLLLDQGVLDSAKAASFELSAEALASEDQWRSLFIERLYSSIRQAAESKA